MRMTPLQPWIAGRTGTGGPGLNRSALEHYQLDRLRATLRQVSGGSAYYREVLSARPIHPDTLADVERFPCTTAADLMAHGPRLLCVPQDDIARVVTLDTSGTTGAPKRLYFTQADQELTVDFFRVGMSTFTGPGDRVLILLPCERPGGVGDLLATAVERLGAVPIRHSVVRDVAATLEVMHRDRVDVAVGVPVQVLALARHDAWLRLRAVLLSTDHVPQAITAAVEKAWSCRVFNHYGMTEMGLGGGVECEARRGYHLREADLYVEIVDPLSGAPLPPGAPGEVVFTTLTRSGMPLVRYRTGDISHFIPGPCSCGTSLRTLARITHRADGVARLGPPGATGTELTLADLDEALFALDDVLDFDATLSGTAERTRLEITARVTDASAGSDGTTPQASPPAAAQRAAQRAAPTAMRAALEAIPALQRAQAQGRFELVVTLEPAGGRVAGPFKRRMKDVREHA